MQPELVSILMPAYNAGNYIARAIDSARSQTYPRWELLVINDGSTDDTEEILSGYRDMRIRFFYQQNAGESAARNLALEHARGGIHCLPGCGRRIPARTPGKGRRLLAG